MVDSRILYALAAGGFFRGRERKIIFGVYLPSAEAAGYLSNLFLRGTRSATLFAKMLLMNPIVRA